MLGQLAQPGRPVGVGVVGAELAEVARRGIGEQRPGLLAIAGGEHPPALGRLGEELLDVDVDVVADEPHRVVVGGDEVFRAA